MATAIIPIASPSAAKTNKHQQALEQINNDEKTEKDEGKPNKLKTFSKAVDWAFRIERAISWFERLFGDE